MNANRLLLARSLAPVHGILFDVWLLPLILEAMEPMQAGALIWILEQGGTVRSDQLTAHFGTTPQRIGSAVSDLRKMGLVRSIPITGESTRASLHTAADWLIEVWSR